jgi:ferredoxin
VKIRVDPAVCTGHALCHAQAPELFTLDDEGYSNVGSREVPAGMEDLAVCPERAITIEE